MKGENVDADHFTSQQSFWSENGESIKAGLWNGRGMSYQNGLSNCICCTVPLTVTQEKNISFFVLFSYG